ncbi:MAG TPA: exonuclease subunit SbcD [Flavobacteriaceae bacterium]|nr:exonuclease subunit SbcD [Flavobacteriaceae bacterium]
MKILHTSDWHIGKHLHNYDLSDDLELFFDWLSNYIKTEKIDVLLVSGDIFDQANPSQAAFKQYYNLLRRLIPLNIKVILTGGNHDSPAALNAPAELLKSFDISVIGGATEYTDLFVKIDKHNQNLVVAAVPFLRDRDIRKSIAGETYATKIEQLKEGLRTYFSEINKYYQQHHPQTFFILMGHLYVQGSRLSESERDIQIGNQAGMEIEMFGEVPHYVALGHIHKPQVVSGARNIHYCGSPIPLSFSEKEDCKQINVITIENNRLKKVEVVPIPTFRELKYFEGSLADVKEKVAGYQKETPLQSLAEIKIIEDRETVETRYAFENFVNSHPNENLQILKAKLEFQNQLKGSSAVFSSGIDVARVTPLEMFEKRLEMEGHLQDKNELLNAFQEILEELNL